MSIYDDLAAAWKEEKAKTFASQEDRQACIAENYVCASSNTELALLQCIRNIALGSDESINLAYLVSIFKAPNSLLYPDSEITRKRA